MAIKNVGEGAVVSALVTKGTVTVKSHISAVFILKSELKRFDNVNT